MSKKIITLLLVFMLLIYTGCSYNTTGETAIDLGGQDDTLLGYWGGGTSAYESVELLLSSVSMVKFSEFSESDYRDPKATFFAFRGLSEFYVPGYIKHGLKLSSICVEYVHIINSQYDNEENGKYAGYLEWNRYVSPENATRDFFYRGASEEYWEERNGVNYAVTEWVKRATQEPDGFLIAWTQHGQSFLASLPPSYTLDEALAFCDLQPVEAWELWGDAVSVSVQGIDGVSILDDSGAAITESEGVLYRINADSGETERIGYKWLIDEDSSRYQYVLEPGEYSFSADKIKKGAGLLVKHFESGDVVSSVDYAKKLSSQSAKPLYLEVTTNPNDTLVTDKIPSSVSVE